MCRNIKVLYNFDPPATDHEIRGAALQFVRKVSGFAKPSKANEQAFNRAVDDIAAAAHTLLDSLVTTAEPGTARSRPNAPARGPCRGSGRPARLTITRTRWARIPTGPKLPRGRRLRSFARPSPGPRQPECFSA